MISLNEAQIEEKFNPFKPKNGPAPQHPRPRKGKTAKDRANDARGKNALNKDLRASWQNDTKSTPFPAHTCNGYRNRYQVTGKGGEVVHLTKK